MTTLKQDLELALNALKEYHGKDNYMGYAIDFSDEISRLETRLTNWTDKPVAYGGEEL